MATTMNILLAVNPLTTAQPKIGKVWSDGLSNNAGKIDDRRKESIPDEIAYLSKIAEPAEQEFRKLLDAGFVSRKGKNKAEINRVQAFKIKKAWLKYLRNWEHQFADDAKRFKDKVKAAENTYAERVSETTLAFTGVKSLESGPARIAVYWLTGDAKARGLLRAADQEVEPSQPFNITLANQRNSLRALLLSRLVQSGMSILHANFDSAVIADVNTVDNHLAQSLIDPGLGLVPFAPGAASHLDFVVENGQLFLSVKVSQI